MSPEVSDRERIAIEAVADSAPETYFVQRNSAKTARIGKRFPGRTWLILLGALLLFVLLRLPAWNAPLIRDEGEFAYAADLLRGGSLPYEHSFLQKPPMTVYCYLLANSLLPGSFWAPRLLAYLFTALATVLVHNVCRREFGRDCALSAVWLATPMILLPELDQTTALAETFMLLPLMGLVAIVVRARHRRCSIWNWFGFGLLSGTALCFKYTALPIVSYLFLCLAVIELKCRIGIRKACFRFLAASLGVVLVAGAATAIFLWADGGKRLWECTVAFNRMYVGSNNFGIDRVWTKLGYFCRYWQIFFLLPLALIPKPRAPVGFWFGLLMSACFATGGSYYRHYYVIACLFWGILVAISVVHLAMHVERRFGWRQGRTVFAGTGMMVLLLCMPFVARLSPGSRSQPSEFNALNPFAESRLVAQKVQQLTAPGDYVYVAGSEPQILVYSHRKSPSRFVIAYPMMIPSRVAAEYQVEAVRDLQRFPPEVIVRAAWNTSWLSQPGTPTIFMSYLNGLLTSDYELMGGYVLNEGVGSWKDSLTPSETYKSSLLVYRRRTRQGLFHASRSGMVQKPATRYAAPTAA